MCCKQLWPRLVLSEDKSTDYLTHSLHVSLSLCPLSLSLSLSSTHECSLNKVDVSFPPPITSQCDCCAPKASKVLRAKFQWRLRRRRCCFCPREITSSWGKIPHSGFLSFFLSCLLAWGGSVVLRWLNIFSVDSFVPTRTGRDISFKIRATFCENNKSKKKRQALLVPRIEPLTN